MGITETQQRLLNALVNIEYHAIEEARAQGCLCNRQVPKMEQGYTYPYARFNKDECIGKPFNQIPWELVHEDGCPLDGQRGVG